MPLIEGMSMKKPRISVLGIGYVACVPLLGLQAKDTTSLLQLMILKKPPKINSGIPPFHEPNLQKLLEETIQKIEEEQGKK
jgi:UDP-glucose 6-dehydrogenase